MLINRMPPGHRLFPFLVLAGLLPVGCSGWPDLSEGDGDTTNSYHERDFLDPTKPGSLVARSAVDDVLQAAAGRRDAASVKNVERTERGVIEAVLR